ncbi:MAG: crossover junction endodeoxyribonuclease RuvC [Clostridiales bacterium]|nr:crossover junction endodeoxyribonuclease RuvC [Clostridiales bacterium]
MIILGIDPGIAIVGFGVIEKTRNDIKVIDYGVITTHKDTRTPVRLQQVYSGIMQLIEKYKPDAIALEELFFNNNITTAITVAQARGVLLIASANYTDNLYEYTPLQIKQALTGNGRAEKKQVQYMVKAILNLSSIPKPDDAADALAVALTHAQTNTVLSQTQIR